MSNFSSNKTTKYALPALHLHEARYFPAANTAHSFNTGEHTRECEPQLPRGGGPGARDICVGPAFSSRTVRGRSQATSNRSWAVVAAAWPTLNRCCSKAKSKARVSGPVPPRRRHVSSVIFICPYFSSFPCLPQVIILESAQGWLISLHRPCVVQRQTRRSPAKGSDGVKMCSTPDEKETMSHAREKEGAWSHQ